MKNLRIALVMVGLLFTISTLQAKGGITFEESGLQEVLKKAQKENKLVFVDVFATWCPPCKYMSKEIFPDKTVGDFFNANFISVKIDGETDEGNELGSKMGVTAYPTLLFLDKTGEFIHKESGARSANELIDLAKRVTSGKFTPLKQRLDAFRAGNQDRKFLADLAATAYDLGRDSLQEEVVSTYLRANTKLNLDQPSDFQIFLLGIHEMDSPYLKIYLAEPEKYGQDLEDPLSTKFVFVISKIMNDEIDKPEQAENKITACVDLFYPSLAKVLGDTILSKEEVLERMLEAYQTKRSEQG